MRSGPTTAHNCQPRMATGTPDQDHRHMSQHWHSHKPIIQCSVRSCRSNRSSLPSNYWLRKTSLPDTPYNWTRQTGPKTNQRDTPSTCSIRIQDTHCRRGKHCTRINQTRWRQNQERMAYARSNCRTRNTSQSDTRCTMITQTQDRKYQERKMPQKTGR